MEPSRSIAERSVTSVGWNVAANIVFVATGFVRSWLLARWLPVDVFGVYALAGSIVALTSVVANFGMGGAFLHRAPEVEDEDQAAAVHFTLKAGFTVAWTALMTAVALVFFGGQSQLALLVLIATETGINLVQTPRLILTRRVLHRRLALLQLTSAIAATGVALGLALRGATLWALLSVDIVGLLFNTLLLFVWHPVWRPRLAWIPSTVRYFVGFGGRNLVAVLLSYALDRVDDLWTGFFLGKTPLGHYSRAYTFATFPRTLLADPISLVAAGTYAELKGDRKRLSQAFFRVNAFLVRSGFLLAGVIALVAPEFIRLMLGEKWLPMLDAFRLMLVFTLFDPMKQTVASLFVAIGRPDQVVRVRALQLAVLITGLFLLGPTLGIAGVALAVDAMLVFGIAALLLRARSYVSLSLTRLFAAPGLASLLSLPLSFAISTLPGIAGSDWRTGIAKTVVFSTTYAVTLLLLERRQFLRLLSTLSDHLFTGLGMSS